MSDVILKSLSRGINNLFLKGCECAYMGKNIWTFLEVTRITGD
jgi:hypothetical protein